MPETHAFDELTKGLASDTLSRRRALKLGAVSALGAALVPFGSAGADAKGRRRNRCKGKPSLRNNCSSQDLFCTRNKTCVCTHVEDTGKKKCVDLASLHCPPKDECDRSAQCPGTQLCVRVDACCSGSRRNVCARRCT